MCDGVRWQDGSLISILNAVFVNKPDCLNRPIQIQFQMKMNCPKMVFNLIENVFGGVKIAAFISTKINSIRNVHIKCAMVTRKIMKSNDRKRNETPNCTEKAQGGTSVVEM